MLVTLASDFSSLRLSCLFWEERSLDLIISKPDTQQFRQHPLDSPTFSRFLFETSMMLLFDGMHSPTPHNV